MECKHFFVTIYRRWLAAMPLPQERKPADDRDRDADLHEYAFAHWPVTRHFP